MMPGRTGRPGVADATRNFDLARFWLETKGLPIHVDPRWKARPRAVTSVHLPFQEMLEACPDSLFLAPADAGDQRTHRLEDPRGSTSHNHPILVPWGTGSKVRTPWRTMEDMRVDDASRRGRSHPVNSMTISTVRPMVTVSARKREPTPMGPFEICSARRIRGL